MHLTAAAPLSVHEARRLVLDRVETLGPERVPLASAAGRVLAEAVVSRFDRPPWDNSAMDGYAVRGGDVDPGVGLVVSVDLPAGAASGHRLEPGTAARIMTGAPMPEGADTVLPIEVTEGPDGPGRWASVGETVRFPEGADPGAHVRPRGEDVRSGQEVLAPGTVLGPAHVAMAATVGRPNLSVVRRPRVSIVSTGDELVDVDRAGEPDRIVASNAYGLAAQIVEAGGDPIALPIVPDDPEATRTAIRQALAADAVVTIGGVSAGERDHVRAALEAEGVDLAFWRVALRPGGPTAFGRTPDGRPVFALPGNPVSALVTFELFARPALRRMAGHERCVRRTIEARIDRPIRRHRKKEMYLRVRLGRDGDGWRAETCGPQGSGVLSTLVAADALLVLPPGEEEAPAGSRLEAIPLSPELAWEEEA